MRDLKAVPLTDYAKDGHGKFVVTAKGDSVRLHALIFTEKMGTLGMVSHLKIPEILKRFDLDADGILLGGGAISRIHSERMILLGELSSVLGSIPLGMLQEASKGLPSDWRLYISGKEFRILGTLSSPEDAAIRWFLEHGYQFSEQNPGRMELINKPA